jgi:hypothetical protein
VSIKLLVKPSPSGATEVFRGATECGSGLTKGSESPFATVGLERGSDTLRISVETEQHMEINPEGNRYWTNADMMHGERISGVELSANARYARIRKSITYKGGEKGSKEIFIDLTTGKEFTLDGFQYWLPTGDSYVRCYREKEGAWCYETVDPKTGEKKPIGKYTGKGHAYLTRDLKKFLSPTMRRCRRKRTKPFIRYWSRTTVSLVGVTVATTRSMTLRRASPPPLPREPGMCM